MSKKQDHLNDCLERLLQGEDLESCLKDYPKEAEELRPLLMAALEIKRYAETAKLRPRFISQTQAKLGMAYQQQYYAKKTRTVGILKPVRRLVAATALAIAVIVVTFTGGFALSVRASENTMPGEILYPVKLGTEQVRLTFALSNDRKVSYLTRFAETRAEEIAYTTAKGDDAQAEAALERLEGHLAQVRNIVNQGQITGVIAGSEYKSPELQRIESIVRDSLAKAKTTLEEIKEPAPQNKDEKPASESKDEEPAPQNKDEKPASESKDEKPAPQNKGEKSTGEKDKIIDRVDKAYSKTIDDIEKAKGDKGNKSDKKGK